MRRQGLKRTIIGALMAFLIAPGIFVLAIILGVRWAGEAIDDADRLSPGDSITLQAGEEVTLYVLSGTSSGSDGFDEGGTPAPDVTCTATGPDGQPVDLTSSTGSSVTRDNEQWQEGYELHADTAGAYTVRCGDSEVLAMDSDFASSLGKRLGGTVLLAFVVPFLVGATGLGLFIWGLVKLSSSKKAAQMYAPGGYPAYGQQPYGQGGYGQPPYQQQPPYGGQQPPHDPYGPQR